jgi:hypothetical protein
MRNKRNIVVACAAALLAGASIAIVIARGQVEDAPGPHWKVTLLRDGEPIRCVVVRDGLPADLGELFEERESESRPRSFLVEASAGLASNHLTPSEREMVEFLLLLPAATLLVCFFRNVVGISSFGTFAPALLGLAFREVRSPIGVGVVLGILFAGLLLRRGLNQFHLLQVPRTALLLSLVVVMLLTFMWMGRSLGWTGPHAITLFPLVILTGMIERFWSMEEEESTAASFRTLSATLFIAGCVWLAATATAMPRWLIHHPETLGLIMAGQLLLGRYTGFRIVELYRFRAMTIDVVPRSRTASVGS